MKTTFKLSKKIKALASLFVIGILISLSSCMPGNESGSGNEGDKPTPLPDPENVQQIGLFYDSGDNLAGLGYTRDGYLTTTVSGVSDWYLSSVGDVPALGNVDYIPVDNWDNLLFPREGMGFVGYSASQGFVRFFVAALAYDDRREVVGVGLKFSGGFTGWGEAFELDEYTYEFDADGGTQTAKIKGNKYGSYQLFSNASWLNVKRSSSNYKFISDCIEIEVEPNLTAEERRSVVTIRTTTGKETQFVVVQAGDPEIEGGDADTEE